MQSEAIPLLVGFVGYSLLSIAHAGQKIGLERYAGSKVQGRMLWVLATISTSLAFFIILAAISLGSISLVGAMGGTGLASLALFSHFVMGERLGARELSALASIIAGAALVGAFGGDGTGSAANVPFLWGILGGGAAAYSVIWIITKERSFVGAIVGGFAGFLGGYSQLFQAHGTSAASIAEGGIPFLRSLLTNPITIAWVGLSISSMVVLQFSYRHGRAIEIIPSFTGNFIIVPIIGGVLIFAERLVAWQWVGVSMIVIGSIMLGRGRVNDSSGEHAAIPASSLPQA